MKRVLVTGAGGFIGSHVVARLVKEGNCKIMGVDVKPPEYMPTDELAHAFSYTDLRNPEATNRIMRQWHPDEVYALAADMGGMGFISCHHAEILRNNLLININTLDAAQQLGVEKYLFSSSACVYPDYKQETTEMTFGLLEGDAYPAQPQDAYGWEKLTTEQLVTHYRNDFDVKTRIARFHNIYGPRGTWTGGREKAPAALCRKIAQAKFAQRGYIEVWGDGEQTRSFCYIDDCVDALMLLTASDYSDPLNIGSDRMISISELATKISYLANWPVQLRFVPGPQGVRGRNSNNGLCEKILNWRPRIDLESGLAATYIWIEHQVYKSGYERVLEAQVSEGRVTQ